MPLLLILPGISIRSFNRIRDNRLLGGFNECPSGWLQAECGTIFSRSARRSLEKILRPVIVYVFLVVLLRAFGKRELAQLNPFDLVVLLSLSNTVQNAIIGNDNSLTGGLIGAFTLLAVNYLVVRFLFRHRRLDQMFEGKPTTLVEHGQLAEACAGERVAHARRADDRAASPGIRRAGGSGAVRPGTGRNVLHPAQDAAHGRRCEHEEVMQRLAELNGKLELLLTSGEA